MSDMVNVGRYAKQSGAYSIIGKTGTMAAGLGAAAPILSVRWATSTAGAIALIDRVTLSIASLGTGFAAGVGYVDMIAARAFSAADTDGAALTLTTNNAKHQTTMDTTAMTEIRISTTATLTAGTRTLDAQALAAVQFPVTTATNFVHLQTFDLWSAEEKQGFPLVLAASEGFLLRATVPATGTWQGVISIDWREVA